jgi:outer membrane receptor protein involved in Fe transport
MFRTLFGARGLAIALIGLPLLPSVARAQQGGTVAGRTVDPDGSPVGLTAVIVQSVPSGDTLSGTLARDDGRFIVQGLAPGRYTLHVSFPGFFPEAIDVLVSELNSTYNLGDVRLGRVGNLDVITVTVNATRAAGNDTQVFRLDDAATQITGSVLDALRNLPGVNVDQDGRVSLRGSDNVAILIDGRQSSMTGFGSQRGLDNVSAANIEAIEIINNPSASFDAAGMAGIINIIYRQDRELGISADLGLSAGMGQFTKQRPDLPTDLGSFSTNPKISPTLSLTYNTERVRGFGQGEFLYQNDLPNNEFTTRYYDDGRVIRSQVPENREQTHYVARLGTDLFLTPANTLTLSGLYDIEHHTDRAQVPFILESTGQRERFWFWTEKETTGFANASFNWKRAFAAPGHELEVNLQYTRGWEDEAYFLNEESPVRTGADATHVLGVENTVPLSIDYVRPLASGRLELGTKLQRRWLPTDYTVTRGQQSVIYQGLGDWSDWNEDLYAGYANFVWARPSYSIEAGLRAEHTEVRYTIPPQNIYYSSSDAYDYFELFPNAKVTYALTDAYRVVAAYNRRIDRPGEPELRIFPKYDDPEILKVGNPYLRPQLTHAYEIGLARSWEGGSLSTALYHRDITDAFLRIFAIDNTNPNYDIVNRIYENAGNSRQTGVEVLFEQQIAGPWRTSGSLNWFGNRVEALETTLLFPTPRVFSLPSSKDVTFDFTVNNRFQLPAAAELQLSFIFYGARNVPQGRERARSSLDIAATWPVMDERAEVIFTFTDMLNDFAVQHDIVGQGFTALYENFLETQVATLGLRMRL